MLITGSEKLERLRNGREVYVGPGRIDDVTTHSAFARAAQTIGELYDWTRDRSRRDFLTLEEDGDRYAISWLRLTDEARGHSFTEADWTEFARPVEKTLRSLGN
jgi:aromatic ring hydroxylase